MVQFNRILALLVVSCGLILSGNLAPVFADKAGPSVDSLPKGHKLCSVAVANLRKIASLTRESLAQMTDKQYNRLKRDVDALVQDPQKRANLLTSILPQGTLTTQSDYILLGGGTKARKVARNLVTGQIIELVEPHYRYVHWRAFEDWRERVFKYLIEQETPAEETSTKLPAAIESGLKDLSTNGGRVAFAEWFSDQWKYVRDPSWTAMIQEAESRNLSGGLVTPRLQSAVVNWAENFDGDWKVTIDPEDRKSFATFMDTIHLIEHPIVQQAVEVDPSLKDAMMFLDPEIRSATGEMPDLKAIQTQMPKARRIMTALRDLAIREIVLNVISGGDSFVVPARKSREADFIVINRSIQLFVQLNSDGTVKSLRLKFYAPNVLEHFMAKGTRSASTEDIQQLINRAGQSEVNVQRPRPLTRAQRIALHNSQWKLNSKKLPLGVQANLTILGAEIPSARNFIEEVVVKAMEENIDLFQNGYTERFLKKIKFILRNEEGLSHDERTQLIHAMLKSKRRSLEVEARGGETVAESDETSNDLNAFIRGDRGLAELQEGRVYEFTFLRNAQFGTQKVVFHDRALKFIKDDPKDVGGIYWLKMIERGIVPDTGMGGLKHRNWTSDVPFEWELKRMKLDWRLLVEKTDDGVWHVMREYEEH